MEKPTGHETIQEYFSKGHSPSSAYHSFCFKKMEELGKEEYNSIAMDRYYFSTENDFGNVWKKHFKVIMIQIRLFFYQLCNF